ncbi:MAG: NAD(P)-binding domain-containing protein [Clostridia bacterium]|nr:NAD(P)-binding domain-containing protein [Clostridia bacterium]
MRLIAFGGDERMTGALEAARRAEWDTRHIRAEEDAANIGAADAVLLPWPHSFREGCLVGTKISKARTLELLPECGWLMHGGGVSPQETPLARRTLDPSQDEAFLRANAKLTAEGAIARAMQRRGRALLGATVLITGFGRIAQELALRLTAMEAFVIVCARNEMQMRRAHEIGAHPVPIGEIASACAQADVVFNTVPARILHERALSAMRRDALVIELASAPYGMDIGLAAQLGIEVSVEGGLPGRYAPLDAGAAMFDALARAMLQAENGQKGGNADG